MYVIYVWCTHFTYIQSIRLHEATHCLQKETTWYLNEELSACVDCVQMDVQAVINNWSAICTVRFMIGVFGTSINNNIARMESKS